VHDAQGKFIAMIELNDLVASLLEVYHELEGKASASELSSLPRVLEERWSSISLAKLLERKDRHEPFQPIPETSSIQDAINTMARTGRRVPVVNAEGKITQIISPFSVVNFFAHHVRIIFLLTNPLSFLALC